MSDLSLNYDVPINEEPKKRHLHPRYENTITLFKLLLKNKTATAGLIISLVYFIFTAMDYIYPQYLGVNNINSMLSFLKGASVNSLLPTPPQFNRGWWYYLGTTEYRIPILPAMLAALKFDIGYSVLIVVSGAVIGTAIGTISGFFGKIADEILMRTTDVFLSIPFIVLAIAVTFVLGAKFIDLVFALIFISWPLYARLARGQALTLRGRDFIAAATASGSSGLRNVVVHVIPNLLSPIFVQISLSVGRVILVFAALYYLSIVRGNEYLPELGNMMVMGQSYLPYGIWWPVVIPGVFLVVFVTALNLLGDGLRDVLDPRLRR
ncbi:MAG: ABC transporter permease [Candidatus Thermoplasmatota archaeon]|nr:ABC transporter permease [Candidatus Thermoplasmatota archaeon]